MQPSPQLWVQRQTINLLIGQSFNIFWSDTNA